MSAKQTAPYGEWVSPITAADTAAGTPQIGGARIVSTAAGTEVWWSEGRPEEGGRTVVRRMGEDGAPVDVLPAPWNARTRVHEYGGQCWVTLGTDRTLVFTEFADQRLYLLAPGAEPTPLTPADAGLRFAELTVRGDRLLAIREAHGEDGAIARDLVLVPLDGSAAADASAMVSLVSGSHFLAAPRFSPDGRRLAWIAWEHPDMPWDATELRVGDIGDDGRVSSWRTILGGPGESVLQPEWRSDEELYVISDRSNWWNLYRVAADGGDPVPVAPMEAELGGPLWQLGTGWYSVRSDGRLLARVSSDGVDRLVLIEPGDGSFEPIETPWDVIALGGGDGERTAVASAGARIPRGIRVVEPGGTLTEVWVPTAGLPDPAYLPAAEARTFQGPEREVHAIVYPPASPDFEAPEGELPPYVAFIHGGPTSHVAPLLSPTVAYFTSRGIGVIDVNYGGSTGYGREYRERLRGQWGVVDVEDTIAAVLGLAEAGLADRERLLIEGGSAGGWTVLAALTGSDVFAAGASYFGVAELVLFAQETHDFESRYLDGLIGPLPDALDLYESRAPVNNVGTLATPVLLLQGLDDPIVPPSQAERFRDAMVERGIPHAYLAFEGESHGFRRLETIVASREAELSFYGQVLGFTPPGVPVLELWRP